MEGQGAGEKGECTQGVPAYAEGLALYALLSVAKPQFPATSFTPANHSSFVISKLIVGL